MTRKQMVRIGVYGTLGVAILIFLAHPFARQMLFGPKIQDLPLCYWQDGFRRAACGDADRDSFTAKLVRWLRLDSREQRVGLPDGADGLRVLLSLVDDPQPRVREQVAHALRWGWRFAPEDSTPALQRLLDDRNPAVRTAAANSLGRMRPAPEALLPRLLELLKDSDVNCRVQAARAVLSVDGKQHREVVPVLLSALRDGDPEIRINVLSILSDLGSDVAEAFPEIAGCATADPQTRVRAMALQTLGAFGKPAIPILVKGLSDPTSYARASAAFALGKVGPEAKETVPALRALLSDSSEDVRTRVKEALHRIDPEQFPAPKANPE